jgi:hypothetical protein
VKPGQIIFGIGLAIALVGLALFYAWRTLRALRGLRDKLEMPAEDQKYFRQQGYRRLICCGLMCALAAMMVGSFALEGPANELIRKGEAARERNEQAQLEPEEQQFFARFRGYWIGFLLLLLSIIVLAGIDFLAIRRYGAQQFRKIQADRREMLEREVIRLRSQRNGHS